MDRRPNFVFQKKKQPDTCGRQLRENDVEAQVEFTLKVLDWVLVVV